MDDREARERVEEVEALLGEIEELPDPVARTRSLELVEALLDLYGEGLARIVERVPEPAALADDELVAHLMLVHDLHPVPLEDRVQSALEEVRPYLQSHGGNVELVSLADGVARLPSREAAADAPPPPPRCRLPSRRRFARPPRRSRRSRRRRRSCPR